MKKILDVTCGGRLIWFNKHHPDAVYCDKREEECEWFDRKDSKRKLEVKPDIVADFTDLPFEDESFALVVFDPPHIAGLSSQSWIAKKYGILPDNWQNILHDGFKECMRVLKPDGVLVFKWSEVSIPAQEVWDAIGQKPLFGHHSGKKSQTFWGCFMKGVE